MAEPTHILLTPPTLTEDLAHDVEAEGLDDRVEVRTCSLCNEGDLYLVRKPEEPVIIPWGINVFRPRTLSEHFFAQEVARAAVARMMKPDPRGFLSITTS